MGMHTAPLCPPLPALVTSCSQFVLRAREEHTAREDAVRPAELRFALASGGGGALCDAAVPDGHARRAPGRPLAAAGGRSAARVPRGLRKEAGDHLRLQARPAVRTWQPLLSLPAAASLHRHLGLRPRHSGTACMRACERLRVMTGLQCACLSSSMHQSIQDSMSASTDGFLKVPLPLQPYHSLGSCSLADHRF